MITYTPRVQYVTENEAVNQLLEDSVGIAVVSRDLTKAEYKSIESRHLLPHTRPLCH